MDKVTNYIKFESNDRLKMSPEGDFFPVWVSILQSLHNLTKKEMEVFSVFLKRRYLLSKRNLDMDMVERDLLSTEGRKAICKECGIKANHLKVLISIFRKKGVIEGKRFYPYLIPNIQNDGVRLVIDFKFDNEQQSSS